MVEKSGKGFFSNLRETLLSDKPLFFVFILIIIFGMLVQFSANYPDNMKVFTRYVVYLLISFTFLILSSLTPNGTDPKSFFIIWE